MALVLIKAVVLLFLKQAAAEEYNLGGLPGEGYCLDINIGHPYQKFKVLIDTGSSSLAVASLDSLGIKPYFHAGNSTTIVHTGQKISSKYTDSGWEADLAIDYVQVPSEPHMPEVMTDLGLITVDKHFYFGPDQYWQGILGLAYPVLAVSGDHKSKTWLAALDYKRGRATSFDMKLCGVDDNSNPYHYGSFRILDETIPVTNNNTVFTTPIIRQWWYELGVLSIRVLVNKTEEINQNFTEQKYEPATDMCKELMKDRGMIIDSGTTNVRLPAELFYRIANELKEAAAALKIPIPDSYWYGQGACWNRSMDWNKSGLPYVGIDLISHEDHYQYFTIEIPPQNYMHFMRGTKNASLPDFCYDFGFELGEVAPGLGVVAFEGLQVTFDKTYDVIRFQTSECGTMKITGPHITNTNYYEKCKFDTPIPKLSTHTSLLPLKWACFIILCVAFLFLCHLLKPVIVKYAFRMFRNRTHERIDSVI